MTRMYGVQRQRFPSLTMKISCSGQKNQLTPYLFSIFSACCSEILTPRSRRDCTISWASIRPAKIRP